MSILSNNIKVALFVCNMLEQDYIRKDDSLTVQSYSYILSRNVDSDRVVESLGAGAKMSFDVRIGSKNNLSFFYERFKHTFTDSYSFIFNARYDERGILSDYDSALVVEGYLTDIDEVYDKPLADNYGDQMTLSACLLVTRMAYVGENSILEHDF